MNAAQASGKATEFVGFGNFSAVSALPQSHSAVVMLFMQTRLLPPRYY
jgi:hypothetical protein